MSPNPFSLFALIIVAFAVQVLTFEEDGRYRKLAYAIFKICLVAFYALFVLKLNLNALGLSDIPKGLAVGIPIAVAIFGIVYLASKLKFSQRFFQDSRYDNKDIKFKRWKLFVELPVETAFYEEFLFRGVILGTCSMIWSTITALLLSSILFGFWHILPALSFAKNNQSAKSISPVLTIALNVIVTTFGGFAFGLVRCYAGSLIVPILAHYSTNASGLIVSWHRSRR